MRDALFDLLVRQACEEFKSAFAFELCLQGAELTGQGFLRLLSETYNIITATLAQFVLRRAAHRSHLSSARRVRSYRIEQRLAARCP